MNDIEKIFYLALSRNYVNKIIEETPVKTGVTRDSWFFLRKAEGQYELVNVNDNIVTYLEEGTKPHIITPKEKKALSFEINDEKIVVKKVNHPGTKGKHWIRKILMDKRNKEKTEKFIERKLKELFNLNTK